MKQRIVYIPIWLDLLYEEKQKEKEVRNSLHSNMVRFIISANIINKKSSRKFTFQYG